MYIIKDKKECYKQCYKYFIKCDDCNKYFCKKCNSIIHCEKCNKNFCNDCKESKICNTCKEHIAIHANICFIVVHVNRIIVLHA